MGLRGINARPKPKINPKNPLKAKRRRKSIGRVQAVIEFLESLPITKGKLIGSKMKLLPQQRAFIEEVYSDRRERTRIAVLSMPRGNGKTGLIAGLMLCHLMGPEAESRGECYSAAIDRQQAGIIFNEMEAIIHAVPELDGRANVKRWRKEIEVMSGEGVGSTYEALSSDARRAHGLAPCFWAFDELAQAKDRVLLDNLQTAMGKRNRSLGIIISTQAEDDEHPLSQIIDDGLTGIDPTVVVHLLQAPKDADPFAEKTIEAVNPALDSFLDRSDIMAEAKRAFRIPAFESAFRSRRLNQRISLSSATQLISPDKWAQCAGATDQSLFMDGRAVYAGLDLSSCLDLTAFVLACMDDGGNAHLMPFAWTPEATLSTRSLSDRVTYDAWVRQGLLRAVPGEAIDYDYVALDITRICEGMNLVSVAFDKYRIEFLRQSFQRIGAIYPLKNFQQGFISFGPAVDAFERLVAEGKMRHGGHPVLKWCVNNTQAIMDPAQNRKPDKSRKTGRIDLAVAAIMAVGEMERLPQLPIDINALIA